jgi:hypothetical protein
VEIDNNLVNAAWRVKSPILLRKPDDPMIAYAA